MFTLHRRPCPRVLHLGIRIVVVRVIAVVYFAASDYLLKIQLFLALPRVMSINKAWSSLDIRTGFVPPKAVLIVGRSPRGSAFSALAGFSC